MAIMQSHINNQIEMVQSATKIEPKSVTNEFLPEEKIKTEGENISVRMKNLKSMLDDGLITEDDYNSKKEELLKQL